MCGVNLCDIVCSGICCFEGCGVGLNVFLLTGELCFFTVLFV